VPTAACSAHAQPQLRDCLVSGPQHVATLDDSQPAQQQPRFFPNDAVNVQAFAQAHAPVLEASDCADQPDVAPSGKPYSQADANAFAAALAPPD
jgi:hypothetical protein